MSKPAALPFSPRQLALAMIAAGYRGEGLRSDSILDHVFIAAANENYDNEVLPGDFPAWFILRQKFLAAEAKRKLGIASASGEEAL